jgi:membrane-associated phospholipid phosphatase
MKRTVAAGRGRIMNVLPRGHLRTSVYRVSPRSVAAAAAGLGLVLLPAVFARQLLRTKKPSSGRGVNVLDRMAIGQDSQLAEWLGNLGTILGIATPLAVDWISTRGKRNPFFEDAVVIGQALALNEALNQAIKYLIQRPLPETYFGVAQNRIGKMRGYRSFYSGHVSTLATALAAGCITVRMRHGRLPWRWPWVMAGFLTVLVGAGRIFSGKHFPSDVLVAATVGGAIGAGVPLLHVRTGRLARAWTKLRGEDRWRAAVRRVL